MPQMGEIGRGPAECDVQTGVPEGQHFMLHSFLNTSSTPPPLVGHLGTGVPTFVAPLVSVKDSQGWSLDIVSS